MVLLYEVPRYRGNWHRPGAWMTAAAGEATADLTREFGISRQTLYQYMRPLASALL